MKVLIGIVIAIFSTSAIAKTADEKQARVDSAKTLLNSPAYWTTCSENIDGGSLRVDIYKDSKATSDIALVVSKFNEDGPDDVKAYKAKVEASELNRSAKVMTADEISNGSFRPVYGFEVMKYVPAEGSDVGVTIWRTQTYKTGVYCTIESKNRTLARGLERALVEVKDKTK